MHTDCLHPRMPSLRLLCWSLCIAGFVLGRLAVSALAQSPSYGQPYRPQVQFSPQRNWTNDPNGPVFFEGEYHLFFQYNPFGTTWGHMSWGHAVSPDLLHWKELPVAIPEHDDEMIFTGSVVVDEQNTSGLCQGGKPCLAAVYTGHRGKGQTQREVQDLAVSQDRGRTWQAYGQNPVLDRGLSDFRDPSVFWSSQSKSWLMTVSLPNDHQVVFYTSPDLKKWTQLSTFGPDGATGGQWECPDLLYVPGAKGGPGMWALKVGLNPGAPQGGSGEQYFLGNFDGQHFLKSDKAGAQGWTDYGKDSYCAISFNHLPAHADPVLIGWMNNWQYANQLPTTPWRGQMTVARRLTLLQDAAGASLMQEPVVAPLRIMPPKTIQGKLQGETKSMRVWQTDSPAELTLTLEPGDNDVSGVRIYSDRAHWTEVGFDLQKHVFYVDRVHAGAEIAPGFATRTEAPLIAGRPLDVHLVFDRSSLAAFAQGGTIAMTNLIYPQGTSASVEFFRVGTAPARLSGQGWRLKSIWPAPQQAETTPPAALTAHGY